MQSQTNLATKSVKELFGIDGAMQVPVMPLLKETSSYIPQVHDHYVFRKDVVRNLLAFLLRPHGDALWITGPTGSGKTSVVLEMAGRLNWPVVSVTCNGTMEFQELRGQFVLASQKAGEVPSMTFRHGPLALAMKKGYILLLNEVDMFDPAELAGLNDVLEGRPLVIAENGNEVIEPHANFRVICTANSAGAGDETGLYQGIQTQNIAAMDRYRSIQVDYPTSDVEEGILARLTPGLGSEIQKLMVKMANDIRTAFKGSDGMPGTLSVTMSTRTLVRWAQLSLDFFGAENALRYALEQALLNRCNSVERESIEQIARLCFGDAWDRKAKKTKK